MDKPIVPVNQITIRSSNSYEFSNINEADVVELEDDDNSVGTVEKQIENLKLDHQFNEKNVPHIFQTLINKKMRGLKDIHLDFNHSYCLLKFDDLYIHFEKKTDSWTIKYGKVNTTIKTHDPEKSIIDHLWFVLKNPIINLILLKIGTLKDPKPELNIHDVENQNSQKMDLEKLNTHLQSMLESIDHQILTENLICEEFNEDTFLSMLKHTKPKKLEVICFIISWKEKGNYQKLKEIVEMDQWKQAKTIFSCDVTPLTVNDVLHCEELRLYCTSVTPNDVLKVTENFFNSSGKRECHLFVKNGGLNVNAIIDALRRRNDGSFILPLDQNGLYFIAKPPKSIVLGVSDKAIDILKE